MQEELFVVIELNCYKHHCVFHTKFPWKLDKECGPKSSDAKNMKEPCHLMDDYYLQAVYCRLTIPFKLHHSSMRFDVMLVLISQKSKLKFLRS